MTRSVGCIRILHKPMTNLFKLATKCIPGVNPLGVDPGNPPPNPGADAPGYP